MISMEQFLETCRQNQEALKYSADREGGASCTRYFSILPLRYAAIGGFLGQRSLLPELPEHLRWPHQAGALHKASYAVRTLREGFLYVLEKRRISGEHRWQTPYQVHADGTLSPTTVEEPAPGPASLDPMAAIRSIQRMFLVHDLDDLENIRLFFSPDRLTPATLRDLERRRNSIPAQDIARFAAPWCPDAEANVLAYDQLDLVVDFAAESNRALRTLLDEQLFNTPYSLSKMALQQALAPDPQQNGPGKHNARGVAIVVEDAIGITQELNAWRNSAIDSIKNWLDARHYPDPHGPGPTNEHRLLIAQAFTELQQNFSERKVAMGVSHHTQAVDADLSGRTLPSHVNQQWWDQTRQALTAERGRIKREELQARADAGEFAQLFEKKYLPRVDVQAMHEHLDLFLAETRRAQHQADDRAADHLLWLQSPQLLTALQLYDRNNWVSGLHFAHQTGLCVMGMEACEAGAQLLKEWWQADSLQPGNLALRAFVYNQDNIGEALTTVIAASRDQANGGDRLTQMQQALQHAKDLADQFSRIDGHLDNLSQHAHINTAGALAWIGQLGRETLRASAPNSLESALHARLGAYLSASLGTRALDLHLAEHPLQSTPQLREALRGRVVKRLDEAYVRTLDNVHSNGFYKTRVASGLLLLEASVLLLQGSREDKDPRFISEVVAGGLTTAAAGLELLAVGTEHALSELGRESLTGRGAEINLGRYRLTAAGLAALGGLVTLWWDVVDITRASKKATSDRHDLLRLAYFARILATVALIGAQGSIAFSQAGGYFRFIALNSRILDKKLALMMFSKYANSLASNRIAMLMLSRTLWIAGFVVIAATTIILILDDDALQKWCEQCCFRYTTSTTPYQALDKEMAEFLAALKEVV